MPRPFNQDADGPVKFHSRAILERDECAKWLAAVVAGWSSAESMLAWHYQMLCGEVDLACEAGMGPGPGAAVPSESFEMIISFPQKIRILNAAVARRRFPEDVVKQFARLLKNLHKAGGDRIVAAHGRWGIAPKLPDELIWAENWGSHDGMMVYSAKDFADALDRIDTRVADFTSFFAASIQPTLKSEAQRTLDRLVAAKNFKKRLEDF